MGLWGSVETEAASSGQSLTSAGCSIVPAQPSPELTLQGSQYHVREVLLSLPLKVGKLRHQVFEEPPAWWSLDSDLGCINSHLAIFPGSNHKYVLNLVGFLGEQIQRTLVLKSGGRG